jgi:NhaC family Na+:H+ antiporter
MSILAVKRVPALLLLFSNVVLGAIWAVLFQRARLGRIFVAATTGFKSETGFPNVDQILSRGGMASMEAVIILVLLAGALGGALQSTGVLDALARAC